VRMVSRDKGLNVVAQLTGMGINEQLCALHLLSQPLVCSPHAVHRAQQALLKGCNTGSASICPTNRVLSCSCLTQSCYRSGGSYGMDR
jgi:hypothetical protein